VISWVTSFQLEKQKQSRSTIDSPFAGVHAAHAARYLRTGVKIKHLTAL
jgi:hypothetical protein